VVHVSTLEDKPRMSQALNDKERHTLVAEGLITKQEIADAEVKDMPPAYRLACQFVPRDEEILVRFSGEPGVGIDGKK
jgi:ferredoxin